MPTNQNASVSVCTFHKENQHWFVVFGWIIEQTKRRTDDPPPKKKQDQKERETKQKSTLGKKAHLWSQPLAFELVFSVPSASWLFDVLLLKNQKTQVVWLVSEILPKTNTDGQQTHLENRAETKIRPRRLLFFPCFSLACCDMSRFFIKLFSCIRKSQVELTYGFALAHLQKM